jgi:hypothetical protein
VKDNKLRYTLEPRGRRLQPVGLTYLTGDRHDPAELRQFGRSHGSFCVALCLLATAVLPVADGLNPLPRKRYPRVIGAWPTAQGASANQDSRRKITPCPMSWPRQSAKLSPASR